VNSSLTITSSSETEDLDVSRPINGETLESMRLSRSCMCDRDEKKFARNVVDVALIPASNYRSVGGKVVSMWSVDLSSPC
jgi:hypothetical protein